MTLEQLNEQINAIQKEAETKIKSIQKDYALANNPYKINDLFKDHIGTIKIEKIEWGITSLIKSPCCVYYGTIINKNGHPDKKGHRRYAYQPNEIK